jgi:hypothetical protein
LRDLWGILVEILDKAKAGAEQVAQLTGKPYDLAVRLHLQRAHLLTMLTIVRLTICDDHQTEEPLYNQVLTAGCKANAHIYTTSYARFLSCLAPMCARLELFLTLIALCSADHQHQELHQSSLLPTGGGGARQDEGPASLHQADAFCRAKARR